MLKHSLRGALVASLVASLLSAPALAQELTGTLKKIKETGVDLARSSRVVDPVFVLR
jgi:hypothetical protein